MARVLKAAGLVGLLMLGSGPAAAHDFWIAQGNYVSPADGSHCCGENDCLIVPEERVTITPDGYDLDTGERIPFSEAQDSEDGYYWRCERPNGARRCFFAPRRAV